MANVTQLKRLLSKLRQRRYYLERKIEQTPKMLSACLILRYRVRGRRDFQSMKGIKEKPFGRSYAYLTYLEGGITKHRYVPKEEVGKIAKLTEPYRIYCENMAQVRSLNRRIVEVLERIGKMQKEEVKNCVQKRTKRIRKQKEAE